MRRPAVGGLEYHLLVVITLGLVAFGLIIGYLTNALVAFCRSNPAYVRLLDRLGFAVIITAKGFVGEVCFTMTLAVSFMVLAMLVMLASDDVQGRLDLPFSNGTGRLNWVLSAVVATSVGTLLVSVLCAGAVAINSLAEERASRRALEERMAQHEKSTWHAGAEQRINYLERQVDTCAAEQRESAKQLRGLEQTLSGLDRKILAICLATRGARCE